MTLPFLIPVLAILLGFVCSELICLDVYALLMTPPIISFEARVLQVNEAIFDDERGSRELPDSLVHFRLNLVELLVDVCQLLRSAIFTQKVLYSFLDIFFLYF